VLLLLVQSSKEMCRRRKKFVRPKSFQHKKYLTRERKNPHENEFNKYEKNLFHHFLPVVKACSGIFLFEIEEKEVDAILLLVEKCLFSAVSLLIETNDWFSEYRF
jgi:hypothetical protein